MLEKNLPEEIKKALEVLETISKDPQMQEAALNLEMGISDYISRLGDAEDKGREEGQEIGARNKSLEIAKQMKTKGLAIEDIVQITGLMRDEVESL